MADIQTQLPVKLTNNVNTAAITTGNALQVDLGATTANATPINVAGSGTAGTPATGVLTIQGIAGATAVIVAGSLTNNNAAPAATNFGALVALATTAAPSYTTGNQVLLSTDLSGNLRVNISASTGTSNVNLTQVGGTAIALGQTTMSASLPVTIASNQSTLTVSGTVTANAGTGTFTVAGGLTHNNAAPAATNVGVLPAVASTAAPTYTAGDQVLLSTDLAGNLRVTFASGAETNVNLNQVGGAAIALGQTTMANSLPVVIASNQSNLTVVGAGTAGTPSGGVVSVQGVAGGTAIPISGTVTANAGTGNFNVVGTLTNNNAAPAATNVGALVAVANSTPPTYTAGDQVLLQTDLNGNTKIALGQNAATTGTITTSSSAVSVAMAGYTGVTVSINGTYAGVNFSFQASDDGGTTWYAVAAARSDNSAVQTTTGVITANSSIMWDVYTGAVTNFRVLATAYTSGTATIHLTPTVVSQDPAVISTIGGVTTVTGNLTHNNAAPAANNVGVLPALANTAAPTYTNGDQVLLSTDTAGALRVNITSSITQANNLTQVGGSSITLGQTTMANSLPVVIASNQSNLNIVGTLTHNNAAPAANNIGVLPAVASTAAPTYTTGDQVLLSTDLSGNLRVSATLSGTSAVNLTQVGGSAIALGQTTMANSLPVVLSSNQSTLNVQGTLTNNNAAPAATNFGVLPALAGSAAPAYTSGDQVLLSVDTSGNLRTTNVGPTTGVVTSYTDSSSVASGSTGTITYTVTAGKTLHLTQIIASSSGGPCRVQVDYGAGPTIIFVGFYAASSPFLTVTFATPPLIAAATAVNVKILNNAGAAQDVYATICGFEV